MKHTASITLWRFFLLLLGCGFPALAEAADPSRGEKIYRDQCAWCHGKAGEGTKRYAIPLIGDLSPNQLTKLIHDTMPEDDPEKCVGEDAAAVARYIYDAFYSPTAQARLQPVRIELSRLTVGQYRNAIADLIGSFRSGGSFELPKLGPQVEPVRYTNNNWEGALFTPDGGNYELFLQAPTDVRGRIWLNNFSAPLIDAWVRSGPDTEFKNSITLLPGRAYRLKIEAVRVVKKGKDGKTNPSDNAPPEVKLLWKPPHGVKEPVPNRYLLKAKVPEVFIVTTPFPPDDRSLGWERGTRISREWDAATTDAALQTADYVASRLPELSQVKPNDPDRVAKWKGFCRTFVERAFRRPLPEKLAQVIVDRQFADAKDPQTAVKRVVLLALKSPRFLYREVTGAHDDWDIASRLAFTLWDSLPDAPLRQAAAAGKLHEPEQIRQQAERLSADPRAQARLRDFLFTWLKLDHPGDTSKDQKRFPGFDAQVLADLRTSLDLTLTDAVMSPSADLRPLLLSQELYLNGRLGAFYGAKLPPDADFTKVKLGAEPRAGVLTHPYLLSVFAYERTSSPIHRGVFLARHILGLTLRPPQDAFQPFSEKLHPNLTTRERVALQTKPDACMSCHQTINALGFTLEAFDAIGRHRTTENGRPVDSSGSFESRLTGKVIPFAGPRDLATYAAANPDVYGAFAEQLFHHLVKQPVRAYGPNTQQQLRDSFRRMEYNMRKLMVEIAVMTVQPPAPTAKPPT
ncbi:MAG: DUF1592 domain-containing protein [Bacteroidales bacterium]|nr:DUF1592 domain-containing protein [Bacteroidales bacterium]